MRNHTVNGVVWEAGTMTTSQEFFSLVWEFDSGRVDGVRNAGNCHRQGDRMDESNPVTHEGVTRAASPKQMRYQLALGAQFDKPVADALARSIASTNIFLNDWAQ